MANELYHTGKAVCIDLTYGGELGKRTKMSIPWFNPMLCGSSVGLPTKRIDRTGIVHLIALS